MFQRRAVSAALQIRVIRRFAIRQLQVIIIVLLLTTNLVFYYNHCVKHLYTKENFIPHLLYVSNFTTLTRGKNVYMVIISLFITNL